MKDAEKEGGELINAAKDLGGPTAWQADLAGVSGHFCLPPPRADEGKDEDGLCKMAPRPLSIMSSA